MGELTAATGLSQSFAEGVAVSATSRRPCPHPAPALPEARAASATCLAFSNGAMAGAGLVTYIALSGADYNRALELGELTPEFFAAPTCPWVPLKDSAEAAVESVLRSTKFSMDNWPTQAQPLPAAQEEQGAVLKKMRNLARRIEKVRKEEQRAKEEIREMRGTRAAFASKELALNLIAACGAHLEAQFKSLERRLLGGATPVALRSEPPGACSQIGFASDEHDHGLRPVAAPCAHDATAAAAAWATQEHLEDELELASLGNGAAQRLWFAALLRSMYGAVRHDPG